MLLVSNQPFTTAELNTIKYIYVEIMNCIDVSFKYESEVMITARPNHRPTRQECLLIYQFAISGNLSGNVSHKFS